MKIGDKIKYYRSMRGLTQTQLSELSGIGLSSLKKYELNVRPPKPEQLKRIADTLQISVNAFDDVTADTVGDIAPYFLALAKKGHIQFHGSRDNDGKFNIDDLSFSFDDPVLKHFLKEWADGKEIIDHLREEAVKSPDETAKQFLLNRADEIEQTLESHMVGSQMLIGQQKK